MNTESPFVEYGKTWRSFKKDSLNKPGTLVEVKNKFFLIGHINEMGGLCNCCHAFTPDEIVARYMLLNDLSFTQNDQGHLPLWSKPEGRSGIAVKCTLLLGY